MPWKVMKSKLKPAIFKVTKLELKPKTRLKSMDDEAGFNPMSE